MPAAAFRGLSLAPQASAGHRQPLREDTGSEHSPAVTVRQSDQLPLLAQRGSSNGFADAV